MKPLRLRFAAFGSYPGEETVDFAALAKRGLFVVTGPTGSGKTTIFDAMVFALYGELPGSRHAEVRPRSHHADPELPTFVELDFEVDGVHYRVHRTPTQERPKKKGVGFTTENTTATLVRVVAGAPESIETQAGRVTKRCAEFVGLDANQFQRVVLLPQGKFTAFLLANEDEREDLLRPLFGGEVFERVTKWLKVESERLAGEVGKVEQEIEHFRANARGSLAQVWQAWGRPGASDGIGGDSDEHDSGGAGALDDDALVAAVAALEPVRDRQEQARSAQRAAAAEARTAATKAANEAEKFDAAEQCEKTLAACETERPDREADAARVVASRAARPVAGAATALEGAQAEEVQVRAALNGVLTEVRTGFADLGIEPPAEEAAAIGAAVQAAANDVDRDEQLLAAAAEAASKAATAQDNLRKAVAVLDDTVAQTAALTGEEGDLTTRINDLGPEAARVGELEAAHQSAKEQVGRRSDLDTKRSERAKADATSDAARKAYEAVMEQFVLTQAPRLAATLHDGDPCPVCGSTAHPSKAVLHDGEPVTHVELDAARGRWNTEQSKVDKLDGAIAELERELGALAESALDALVAGEQAALKALTGAQTCARLLDTAQGALADLRQRLDGARGKESAERQNVDGLTAAAGIQRSEADRLAGAAQHLDASALTARKRVVAALAGTTADLGAKFGAVTAADALLNTTRAALAEALTASGYVSVEAAVAALLDTAEEERLDHAVVEWEGRRATASAQLDLLRQQGVPATRPDAEALDAAASQAESAAEATDTEFVTASNALGAAAGALGHLDRVGADSAGLRRAAATAQRVFLACNGKGPVKVNLERWVLARELEVVTTFANEHLARMTNRRYALRRDDTQGGLRLEVFDAHTGKTRATNSLSGGEQFQASLALALGLADVVSHGGSASGKQFDALFVDEGFGSLDQQSLGDAINALEMIQSTGRMVGAITHVEEMKERLHKGIEVSRLPDDRGSTLRVNP